MTSSAKKVPTGPIRTGVVVPLLVLGVLTFLYFKIFFDAHVKWVIEYAGTKVNGAQVDVESFNSSFLGANFELKGFEMTDKENPRLNLFEVKHVGAKTFWDSLLRGKLVIDDFAVEGISWQSPRKSPGKVLPVEVTPEGEETSAAGKLAGEAKSAALQEAQKEFQGNALGDLAAILEGGNAKEQIGEIRESLESEKYLASLEQEFSTKQKAWEAKIKGLPTKEEFEQLAQKIKDTKLDSNPLLAAKQVKAFKDDLEKINNTVKVVKEAGKEINTSIDTFEGAFKNIDDLIEKDLKALQTRFNIPTIDTKNLARSLFGPLVVSKLGKSKKYIDMARQYLPSKKSAQEKKPDEVAQPKPRPRAVGVDYRFPKKGAYPLFWLKAVSISSKAPQTGGGTQGNLAGKGSDITTDSQVVGRPMLLQVGGDFPGQNIFGVKVKLAANHHVKNPSEEVVISVADYPLAEYVLSKSEKLRFGFNRAQMQSSLTLTHSEENISMSMNNRFRQVDYLIEAQNKKVQEILGSIIRGLGEITLGASANGSWSSLQWDFKSNLGEELSQGLKREVAAQVDAGKAKLKKLVDDKIGAKRKALEGQFGQVKGKLKGLVGDREKGVDDAKALAQSAIDEKIKGQGASPKDALKGLKKKFKI